MERKSKTKSPTRSQTIADKISNSKTPRPVKPAGDGSILSTGADLLDLVVGGGHRLGKVVNVVGDKSTGKTYLAIECIATARKMFGKNLIWHYCDAEAGFSFDTTEMYGYPIITKNDEDQITTVEEFRVDLKQRLSSLKSNQKLIYVLDSLDALSSEAEMKRVKKMTAITEKAMAGKELSDDEKKTKGSYGMDKQKFMSEFFRTMVKELENKNCLLIIISQVRENIGVMFGEKYRRSGGKALDFYAHTILWLAEVEKIKKKDRVVGICIKARTTKAKIKNPFRSCYIELVFDYGIDNITSNIKYLYDLKDDRGKDKGKSKVKWDGKEYTVPGLVSYIEAHDLEDELRARVTEKWDEIERSVSSEGRKSKWGK